MKFLLPQLATLSIKIARGQVYFPHASLQVFNAHISVSRIFEGINNIPLSVKYYREILHQDAMNVEAVACIAVHYFYSDQPELALRFYR